MYFKPKISLVKILDFNILVTKIVNLAYYSGMLNMSVRLYSKYFASLVVALYYCSLSYFFSTTENIVRHLHLFPPPPPKIK